MKRILTFMFMFVLLLTVVSATVDTSLNVIKYKPGSTVQVIQTCSNCTSLNITSINYPNSTQWIGLTTMQKTGTEFNATVTIPNVLGLYTVNCVGDPDGVINSADCGFTFEVAVISIQNGVFEGIMYVVLLGILFIMLGACVYGSFKIPHENIRNTDEEIIKIEWKKYARWGCMTGIYIITMFIFYIGWNLSYGFLQWDVLTNIFKMFYRVLMVLSFPTIIVSWLMILVKFVREKKMEKLLERGLTIR